MLGVKIKNLRMEKGYSISQLAAKAQVSKSYLSHLENHQHSNPSLHILSKLATTLETPLDYFLGDQQSKLVRVNEEWLHAIEDSVKEGMTMEEFFEFQLYLKYRRIMKGLAQTKNTLEG